jgi:hypothetical protein
MEPRDSADYLDLDAPVSPYLLKRAEETLLLAMQEGNLNGQSVNVALNVLALGAHYNWT